MLSVRIGNPRWLLSVTAFYKPTQYLVYFMQTGKGLPQQRCNSCNKIHGLRGYRSEEAHEKWPTRAGMGVSDLHRSYSRPLWRLAVTFCREGCIYWTLREEIELIREYYLLIRILLNNIVTKCVFELYVYSIIRYEVQVREILHLQV